MPDGKRDPGATLRTSNKAIQTFSTEAPVAETVVAMTEFKGALYVATTRRVYRKGDDGVLSPLQFTVAGE